MRLLISFCLTLGLFAQDPVSTLEGIITDTSGGALPDVKATATHLQTGVSQSVTSGTEGRYRFAALQIGTYSLEVESAGFALYKQQPIELRVSEVARVDVRMELASVRDTVIVEGDANLVDTASNALGKTVTTREILDLPLNGRNFTQLGLLQAGVAPITNGVATSGGSLRAGQAYAVNGQRPESNNYLLDGAKNVNRMDGGFALRVPVDAIAEFRILTHTAPPEYGGTSGSNTSVVTKSGGNEIHGTVYEFFRNDIFDARNFFSEKTEPLKQNQFGGTIGGPIQKNRLFFFGYAEGFRNRQGITRSGNVPSPAQRQGDFSGNNPPLIDIAGGGIPFPGGKIPDSRLNVAGLKAAELYPLGNTSPTIYTSTVVTENESNQAGGKLDWRISDNDQLGIRYSFSDGHNINPISIRGSDLPGFPVRDDLRTNSAVLNHTRLFSPNMVNSARGAFFRHMFLFDQRLNHMSPRDFGLNYDSTNALGQSAPYFNVNGYSPVGGAIVGPRNSAQTSWEFYDAISWTKGSHSLKFGGEVRRQLLNMFQAIAPNAFFVFTPSFPSNDAFANLLMGRPLVFYQGHGDISRGMRGWENSLFVQDEWRVNRRLTLNYGVRWEVNTPLVEVRDRMNAFVPGQQSTVNPTAPRGILFPGDEGVPRGIASTFYKGLMPRLGFAWNPDGRGVTSIRASYGIFFDAFSMGSGVASQVPVSSLPWTQFIQFSGPSVNFTDPYAGRPQPQPNTFNLPVTMVVMDKNARPPYAQNWNFSLQHSLADRYLIEARYVGSKGTHLPRNIEANPAVYGLGATSGNAEARRIYSGCQPDGTGCQFSHVGMLSNITNSTYHSGQLSVSRRYNSGLGFNASYWYSKTLDYLSAMNLGGAGSKPISGENDVAQNPFNLRAEHGPSLFDSRHRLVFSGGWEIRLARNTRGITKAILDGWQLNGIVSANSGTPFTVYDTTNVSLQAPHPPLSGYNGSRPDLIANPNAGPRTVEQWVSRSAFRRLNPATEAGQFGNAGRNVVRGPGFANVDVSLLKTIPITERTRLQFRAECFNAANHANFFVPVNDLNSANFGRITEAGPPRLYQLALKVIF